MTPLRQRMVFELKVQRKSANTIKAYLMAVEQLANYYGRSPEHIAEPEIREFFRHLIEDRKLASGSINTKLAGVQFLYTQVLGYKKFDIRIPRKRRKRLPQVLSRDEVKRLLEVTDNPKHRVMLMTAYAAGLRVSEVVNLKVTDIHSGRMMLLIRHGKGGKDRYSLLSTRLLKELRNYWRLYRPTDWLFVNRNGQPISTTSLQKVFNQSKATAGITHGRGIHCLRHSFATHLLESGIDLTIIARLLGHRNLSTTSVYLHVTSRHMASITSPLDLLPNPRPDVGPSGGNG